MDPATILALSAAVISAIQKVLELHAAAVAGQITGADAIRQLGDFSSSIVAAEIADDAAADAIVKQRFP